MAADGSDDPFGIARVATIPLGSREWWSRTGSNRRHPACKAGALPAELRPLISRSRNGQRRSDDPFRDRACNVHVEAEATIPLGIAQVVGLGGLEPPTSRLSSARSNQL